MEEENVVQNKKGNFIIGAIFSLIGGMIASIPWILVYVYGNMIYSALAIIIAVGAFLGYKLSKAKMDRKVPVLIAIVSILCVTISTLLIIPMLMLAQENYDINYENLKLLYSFTEFKSAIIQDYIVSFVFTILGISGIVVNLNKQIKAGIDGNNIKIMTDNSIDNTANGEIIKKIKDVFVRYNAVDKIHGIRKQEVLNEIEDEDKNVIFGYLQSCGIIKKSKGKFYYSEETEKNPKNVQTRSLKTVIITILLVVAVVIAVPLLIGENSGNINNSETNTSSVQQIGTNMKIKLTEDMTVLTEEEINTIYGQEGFADFYEFIAMNQTGSKVIYGFILKEEQFQQKMTPKEYLELSFEGIDVVKIKEKNISGYDFTVAEYDYKYQEKDYKEIFVVNEEENEFICLDVIFPTEDSIDIETLIEQKGEDK